MLRSPSSSAETRAGLLGGRDFLVLASRGGGYQEGAPPATDGTTRSGGFRTPLEMTGLEPRFITAELTLSHTVPATAELIPLAERSLAEAERAIDGLWSREPVPCS